MLVNDVQQLKRHAAWLLSTRLPLLNSRLACVQVHRKNWLTDFDTLSNFFDLQRFYFGCFEGALFIKHAHGCFINGADPIES